jgi:starch phosphorylase
MRTLFDFRVEPRLPQPLHQLKELAYNIWWCWNPSAIDLFRRIDPDLWEETHHNPVLMLNLLDQETLEQLADDRSFLELLDRISLELELYRKGETWYSKKYGPCEAPFMAYFSMEFGLTECLRLYSGGLGVLSGDHIKSASDLGLPLVGFTLLFQQGYFQQYLNPDGWQQERYPVNEFPALPLRKVRTEDGSPLRISVPIAGRTVYVQVWRCSVGRVALYGLDTNLPENSRSDQDITDQLYGGDQRLRIQQEIVLGIGGIRALHAIGIKPVVCHVNEGHAAFTSLERIRFAMVEHGLSFREARVAMGGGNVFTTHTPVPAGFDLFPAELMKEYLGSYATELGISMEDLLRMGRGRDASPSEPFNMAIMALKNSTFTNAVSALHGRVTRNMAASGFKGFPVDEIPIEHVTNGVHLRSWMSRELSGLLDRYLGSAWRTDAANPEVWEGVDKIPSSEFWRTHERRRERLVAFARARLRKQRAARGASQQEINQADEVLDPEALTIGFARRFATYKRATLLFEDAARLRRILTDTERPVQIIFAGKAHPHDDGGKELIKAIIHFARDAGVRDRVVFLEDYDISIARRLVQGVDVWLNTPRRPLEASGTSGMKVAANGGLNLSILDGWWDEGYRPGVGWAIGQGEEYADTSYQDTVEANAIYDLLEDSVVPLFYDRGRDMVPRRWIAMMKAAMRELVPFFNTDRMVIEYNDRFYIKARDHHERLAADDFKRARALAGWKSRVVRLWKDVKVEAVNGDDVDREPYQVGAELKVEAAVWLGELTPDDVRVEMYVGRQDELRNIRDGVAVAMQAVEPLGEGRYRYQGVYRCAKAGMMGLGIRVFPWHPDLAATLEMGRIVWA